MDMKRVSFKVAKAIKDAGYPQGPLPFYDISGDLWEDGISDNFHFPCFAPTYVEVWMWLWKEKGVCIDIDASIRGGAGASIMLDDSSGVYKYIESKDPEEAIKEAIEYIAENNLIK